MATCSVDQSHPAKLDPDADAAELRKYVLVADPTARVHHAIKQYCAPFAGPFIFSIH